ncbi:iron-containing alcohol dehydrogenase [Alteribacillus iranensis]|uniref:Alcohol dehydrogenase/alcohol dehydrogenase n=1 Tax=Alteribacillus iranensis TaxID=930128 RepID=A0A1I2FI21_9BACI|nr:iron-containing alcohol dehydrogenase [Alteribacillus iranensis]SFF04418.1 alcohol dehydrogenase/alcohol dehydrogenase [Alteribacillus iranensis]
MNFQGIFDFNLRTNLLFGEGSVAKITNVVQKEGFQRVLVICDKGIQQANILTFVTDELERSGAEYVVFSDVEANPTTTNVNHCMEILNRFQPDFLIGVGGGSPLDVAKAVSLLATNGGKIEEYEGIDTFEKDPLPLLAVPTTAGTGSEVTIFTVITNPETEYKLTAGGKRLAPKWAVMDPELTRTLPPHITAATGMDALVHAIESYTSTATYPLTETLALEAIRVISSNLRQAVFNGDNMKARTAMLYGSLIAGVSFNNTRLGNVHAMSHPLSAMYNVPHGVANSVLLPYVMTFNLPAAPEKFVDIAKAMGEYIDPEVSMMENAYTSIKAVERLAKDVFIAKDFSRYHVKKEDIQTMAEDAMKSGNVLVNPRKTRIEDIIALYEETVGESAGNEAQLVTE